MCGSSCQGKHMNIECPTQEPLIEPLIKSPAPLSLSHTLRLGSVRFCREAPLPSALRTYSSVRRSLWHTSDGQGRHQATKRAPARKRALWHADLLSRHPPANSPPHHRCLPASQLCHRVAAAQLFHNVVQRVGRQVQACRWVVRAVAGHVRSWAGTWMWARLGLPARARAAAGLSLSQLRPQV